MTRLEETDAPAIRLAASAEGEAAHHPLRGLKLYHGTRSSRARKILKEGLRPRCAGRVRCGTTTVMRPCATPGASRRVCPQCRLVDQPGRIDRYILWRFSEAKQVKTNLSILPG